MIQNNLGLVHACAKRFKNKGIEYDDLYGAGCEGLIKAVDRFDTEYGVQFSTYAVPVILGEIKRLFRDGGTVKVSRSLKELSMKISKETARFTTEHGREPTISELSQILDIEPGQVAEGVNAGMRPMSLTGASDDSEASQIDIPADDYEEKLTELLSLRQVMYTLSEDDKRLINLRFFKRKTQCETGEILNMSQVQVSRREKKILVQLKEKLTV